MTKYFAFIIVAFACLFCQCTVHHAADDAGSDYPSLETFTAIDRCMSFMTIDPPRAHQMLDSLQDAGLMSRPRCDYYHAMVIYSGEHLHDSALVICDRLLDAGQFGNDRYLEEEICVLASDITACSNRHVATLRYANRGIALCHGDEKMQDDEALLLGRVGLAEQELGRTEQARQTYARASQLLSEHTTFADLVTLISLQKKQAALHSETRQYDQAIALYQEILALVNRFDRDPSFIGQRPATMQESGDATHDFADFYRSQLYGRIACCYRMKIEQGLSVETKADTDSVQAYIDQLYLTERSQAPDILASILPELFFLGKKAAFDQAKPIVAELHRGDTLTNEYAEFLMLLAADAKSSHDLAASNAYLERALVVGDSIRHRDLTRMLAEQMSLNMVQEQKLARLDAERQLAVNQTKVRVLSAIICILLVAAVIIIYLARKSRERQQMLERAQQDLAETQEEILELNQQLEETIPDHTPDNIKALYERIERAMAEKKLYLNPDLDLKMLAEAACSSRSVVSLCINSVTGKSFRLWTSEYRLSLFEQKLHDNPDESIDILMAQCGYKDQSTFRRQFKAAYGMTVSEYRRQVIFDPDSKKETV